MADYSFNYTDPGSGKQYEVFYDFLDPYEGRQESAHIALIQDETGKKVTVPPDVKTRMRFAAVQFHLADIRRQIANKQASLSPAGS